MKLYSALQIDEIGTKIAAKIKAITAKTNLLKTAAYRDVGTTAGKIPEFVGNDGMGGFGFGGRAKDLGLNVNLDTLPKINAIYSSNNKKVAVGLPPDLEAYIYVGEFTIQTIVNAASYHQTQIITATAFKPPSSTITNSVVFIRTAAFSKWSSWERIAGLMTSVDSDAEVIGDDGVFNSIKVGATSPKIAFEVIRLDITFDNFGYSSDGVTSNRTDGYDFRATKAIETTVSTERILNVSWKCFTPFSTIYMDIDPGITGSNQYLQMVPQGLKSRIFIIKTTGHLQELGEDVRKNGDALFNNGSYIELFITYKVD